MPVKPYLQLLVEEVHLFCDAFIIFLCKFTGTTRTSNIVEAVFKYQSRFPLYSTKTNVSSWYCNQEPVQNFDTCLAQVSCELSQDAWLELEMGQTINCSNTDVTEPGL